jgi:hypothetical protein
MIRACFAQELPPLQSTVSPGLLLALAVIIVLIFLLNLFNKSQETKAPKRKKPAASKGFEDDKDAGVDSAVRAAPQGPDKSDLKYVIKAYGFNKEQAELFARLCNGNRIHNPSHMLQEEGEFNDFFTRTLRYLDSQKASGGNSERYKTILFTIKEKVDNYKHASRHLTSTRGIRTGQQITVTTKKDEQYPSTVMLNTQDGLLCSVPRDDFGNELRLPLWSRITVFFYAGTGESYQLDTKIRRYESARNETRMVIAHTDTIKPLPNRNHVRKSLTIPCRFTPVTVANIVNGKHTEHKYYPSSRIFDGTLEDISAGGCSIATNAPIPVGEYAQITFKMDGINEDTIIVKIVKHRAVEDSPVTVMHIQFAKIPRASMNRIFSFIYNHGDA